MTSFWIGMAMALLGVAVVWRGPAALQGWRNARAQGDSKGKAALVALLCALNIGIPVQ